MARFKPGAARSERFDLYQHVTDQIVAALDQGVRPWVKPWSAEHLSGRVSRPLRACGKNYRGINCLVLWLTATAKGYGSPYWLTYRQAVELGGNVRKGEHGAKVCYFYRITREAVDQNTGEATAQHIPFIKTYTVFSAEQCEGLPAHFTATPAPASTPEIDEARLAHAEAFIAHTGADIRYGGDRACYAITADRISMPPFAAFASADAFYSTVLHELCHYTKHEKRLNRDCGRKTWGDEGYAMEELVAELGSAFLCADLNIGLTERMDHASYIDSWLRVLRGDRRAIFQAAAMAERAADWLHACQPAAGGGEPTLHDDTPPADSIAQSLAAAA